MLYTSDILTGMTLFSFEQRGQYITLLCQQHQLGHLPENHMISVCLSLDSPVAKKFKKDENGLYYNVRMEREIEKRITYCKSKSHPGKSGRKKKSSDNHPKTVRKSTGNHTENENDKSLKDKDVIKKGTNIPPNIKEVAEYIREKGYPISSTKWWNHYNSKGWMIGKNKMKNWHSAVATWLPDKTQKKKADFPI